MKLFNCRRTNLKTGPVEKISADSSGSMLLEMSLIMPVLLILLAGIVQFGFILNAKVAVNSAAYEAARAATVSGNPYEAAIIAIENYSGSAISGWNFNERLRASIKMTGTDPGSEVIVEVSYLAPVFFYKIVPFDRFEANLAEVKGRALMRIEEKE
jgi:uncharacterized protein (UPF0333 family)